MADIKLQNMNAKDAGIKAGTIKYIERPYIYNFVVNVPGSGTIYTAGTPSVPYILNIAPYDFEWVKSMFTADNGTRLARVSIQRSTDQRYLTGSAPGQAQTSKGYRDNFIPLKTWAGSGKFPKINNPSLVLPFNTNLTFTFQDESGASSAYNIYMALSGINRVPVTGSQYVIQGPWKATMKLPTTSQRLTINANQTYPFSIQATGGDYVITALMIDAQGACLVSISYNSIPVTSGYIHSGNIDGEPNVNGTVPNILPAQMEVPNLGNIDIVISDISGATNNVDLTLDGFVLLK